MRGKRNKSFSKKGAIKLARSKYVNRKKKCILEIKVPENQENTIICTVPVVEIGIPKRINGKYVRKVGAYRFIDKDKNSEWGIVKVSSPFKTPDSLIDSKIMVTNGKKTVSGVIVKASISGGGATSPASEGGLPPVDE